MKTGATRAIKSDTLLQKGPWFKDLQRIRRGALFDAALHWALQNVTVERTPNK